MLIILQLEQYLVASVRSRCGLPSQTQRPTIPDFRRLSQLCTFQCPLSQETSILVIKDNYPSSHANRNSNRDFTSPAPEFCFAFDFIFSSCSCRLGRWSPNVES
jgi:hypothetical protein